jgi:transposase-like protein
MPNTSAKVGEGRWSPQDAEGVLDLMERSGLSVQRFAKREGLDPERLYRWRRKLREQPPQLVEFALPATQSSLVEIALQSGLVVRFPETARLELIGALVKILKEQDPC